MDKTSIKIGSINISRRFFLLITSVISFSIPFFIGQPQILVGTIVNGIIIWAGLNLPLSLTLPIIILPSIGALSRGVVFGPLTPTLYYFMPFIWFGNLILFRTMKISKLKSTNYFLSVLIGGGLKAGFLFLSAMLLFRLGMVPGIFLTSMGILQLATAILGGVLVYKFIAKSE